MQTESTRQTTGSMGRFIARVYRRNRSRQPVREARSGREGPAGGRIREADVLQNQALLRKASASIGGKVKASLALMLMPDIANILILFER